MELASRNSTGNSLSFYKSQMDEEYLKASKSGDLNKVLECLAAGVKPDVTNPGGLNILHFAARENHLDICKVALNHGIDIKALTKRLNTALHIASLGGHTKIVKLLIDHGAKVNLQAKDDITPLYMAAQENHIDTVDILLKYGANPNIAAKGGFEPLDIAVQQGHVDVVTMLLEKDAKHGMKAMHQAAKKNDKSALKLLINDGKHSVNARAPNGYTPLHIASKFGSVNAANYLIDHGADLNAAAKHNIVPLHVASRHARVQSISVLVKAGADLSICTKDGLSALHCAARDGHDHCVELLLVHGAPITAKTRHGLTALHMASQGDHVASANHLLAHGAHIDDVTSDGVTSLHVTSHYGQVKTAQLLLEKGANIDHRALNGYTALHIASKKNREAIVQLLLKHKASVHIKNNNGQTALHVAAFFGHVSIVLLLLQAGASTEALTVREETVLHIACRTIRIQIVRLLIRNNAKINAQTKDGETPLHVTCRQGDSALVSVLLDNYADPNVQNKEGSTALHLGARDGNEDIVDSLLDHKADVTLLSKRGFTPLHEASKNGHEAIVETLLGRRETNVNASGKNGLTPLHIACHYDQSEVAIQLLNAGADIQAQAKNGFTPLHISAKKSQINICNLLFERGVEADMTTRHGVSPLHLAVKEGDIQIVDTLLEHGASPSLQTTNGLSPLHVAVHYNKVDVVKRLLKYTTGIVNLPTQTGFTPLHLAASYGHYEMAKLLLENEANVEAKTKTGNTPLHLATVKGHTDVIDLLLKYNAPPNALNKEGHTALYLAEITQQVTIITVLQKITTKIVIKKEESKIPAAKRWERVRHIFLNPEALEETLLIEATDEAEDKVHKEKKSIQKDFEEDFAGLEDHPSPVLQQKQTDSNQVVEDSVEIKNQIVEETEIAMVDQSQVENSAQNDDDYLNSLDAAPGVVIANGHDEVPEKKKEVRVLTKKVLVERDYQKIISENSFLSGPPKQGTFLISFNVDARGATMVSKQSGIRITLPPGACQMPTRVTVRFRKSDTLPANLTLLPQERIASRVLQISPDGMDLLRPVTLEIPHFVALKLKERELVVMKNDPKHSKWKEVPIDENATKTPGYVAVTLPEVPDKLVLVSRPLKERYAMNPSGGEIRSASIPDVAITFPQKTLNTTTKLILQSQRIDRNLITSNSDQAPGLGPIISLDPPTKLSKPINVTTPLPKGNKDGKLHLLAWVPKDAKASSSSSIRLDCEWKDITESTPLKVVGHSATFSTNDFTRYWLIQTKDIESTLKNIGQYEEEASIIQYNAQFIVYARMLSEKSGELRICLITDDYAAKEDMFNANEGFTELARSDRIATYKGQTLNIRLAEEISTNQSPRNMRITFQPFQINSIQFRVDFARSPSEGVVNGLVSFISERIRKDEAHFCFFEIKFGPELCKKVRKIQLPEDTVNDDVINMVGQGVGEDWFPLADELNMSNRDKQAVVDISSGKYDIAASRMLEYWRAKKPINATYKQLFDALKRLGYDELAENVYNASPNEISREVQSRPVSSNRHYATSPSFDTLSVVKKTGVEHARQSPPMESDSQFSVSPVPSDDRLSPLIADSPPPVLEERPGFRRSKTDLESRNFSPDVASEKYLDEESGKRIEFEESPVSSSEYNRERWSTTATYATNTPEEDKVPITPSDDGRYIDSPVSPVSIRSERSKEYQEGEMEPLRFRTESFENSIATPCDVSAAVTPHSISPECTDDAHTETEVVENVYSEDPPVVDFSALGDVQAEEDFHNEEIPTEEPRALSPYELSMQRVHQEEQEAWEQDNEERPRDHGSKSPVDENDVLEVKEEKVESGVEFDEILAQDVNDKEEIADDNILVQQPNNDNDEGCVFVEKQTIVHEISLEMCPDEDPSVESLGAENIVDTENEPDNNDEFVEQQQIVQGSTPGVDFSVLGEPEDANEEQANDENENRVLSPYQLSMQRAQQEEEEAWERDNEERPRDHGSKTPVDEENIMDEKEEREESAIDLNTLEQSEENVDYEPAQVISEEHDIIVPQEVAEEEATPCFELTASERCRFVGEKLIEGPTHSEEVQSSPYMDFDDVNDEKINQAEQSFYSDDVTLEQIDQSEPSFYSDDIIDVKLNQSEPSIDTNDVILDQSEPVEYEMEEPSRSEISAFSIDESPSDSFTTISDDSMNTSDNVTTISAISDDFGDETTKVVAYHDNGDIMQHDDGFSKVIKSTVVQESVTMMTKTEVREVSPEELQQLLAQQQQGQQTGGDHQQGAITTTVVQQQIVRTQISSESGNNVPIETNFEPTEEVVIKSSVTRETSENVNVLEIELHPDEESLTNEELVERMFGNEENVIEFFKQDDDQQLTLANTTNDVDNDDKDVSKVDDYGTQV